MDEHGVDTVSLNEINMAAGRPNGSLAQAHFGTRENLAVQLVNRTMIRLDVSRTALVDHLESTRGGLTPREAAEVIIAPMARLLETVDGRRHLRLVGQLINHPRYNPEPRDAMGLTSSLARCAAYLLPTMTGLPGEIMAERAGLAVMFAVRAISDQARVMDAKPRPRPVLATDAFSANLVDMILAMLTAPNGAMRASA